MDLCAAATRSGGTCKNKAGKGTDHPGYGRCKNHGGSTRNHKAAATRAQATEMVEMLSIPVETTPEEALLTEVEHVAGDVKLLRQQVQALGHDLTETVFTEGGAYRKPDTLVEMYWQAHDRLVKVCAATIKAGVEERRVRLAEHQADVLEAYLRRLAEAWGVPDTPETWEAARAQWRVINGGAA